ncbi:hypothetical protein FE257_007365 [Aspergillus nanangensis]|uniref:Uncharacterized protein n=1 Tax=Aspergillus nanangensis TaxID=2582783 RepID=A0AAD4CNG3_ASPNN|nr:hypothetical protein FE257_007365 [Aspergillus nanangensis]
MSQFFPQTEYAEDQPLARTILTTHVLNRGFQAGSAVGLLSGSLIPIFKRQSSTFPALLLRSTGIGGCVGTGLISLSLAARMWGAEEIEWKDRSWRLQHNAGQVAVDRWSQPGAVIGGALAVAFRRPGGGVLPVLGGAGWGALVGAVGGVLFR